MRQRIAEGTLLRAVTPWAVLALWLAVTATAWFAHEHARAAQARNEFRRRGDAVAVALASRLEEYTLLLQASAARVASTNAQTPATWSTYVEYLDLPRYYPALRSLTYSREPAVPAPDAVRRAAILVADGSGAPAISSRVTLTDADAAGGEAGFVLVAPMPRNGAARYAVAVDDAPGAAWVAGDVCIPDLLRGVLDARAMEVLDLRIYDGERIEPAAVLVDTRTEPTAPSARFERTVALSVPGRAWTLQFLSRPEYENAFERDRPWGFAAAGIALSFLAFLVARSLALSFDRAHHLSMRDPLTGLFNRRYLDETLEREMQRARRENATVGVIVLDLDHFKRLNDTYGHDAGDHVLARTGEMLRHLSRGSDIACRLGGEEFALILPGATLATAAERAEAIRSLFASTPFEYDGKRIPPLTLSAGVAALVPGAGDWAQSLHQADRALYAAKQSGRNRVIVGPAPD